MSGTNYIASNWRTPENSNSSKNDNYSLDFNGSSDFISCGNDPQIQLTGDISISAWFKTTETGTMIIAAKRDSPLGGSTLGWQVYCTGGNIAFNVTRSGPATTTAVGGTWVANGEWHHVLCTIDQDSQIAIILDGQPERTAILSFGTFIDSNSDLRIGYNQVGSQHYYFNGEISEVALFDYLVSGATLYGDATSGAGNPMALKPTPVGYWPLGDNSASDPLAQPNVAVNDASVFEFDGSGSSDEINTNATLSGLGFPATTVSEGSFSVSFWYNATTHVNYAPVVWSATDFNLNDGFGISQQLGTTELRFWVGRYAFSWVATSGLNTSQWYHIVCVFTGGSTYTLQTYVDGAPSGSTTGTTSYNINSSTNPIYLGSSGGAHVVGYPLDGKLSNTQIWNKGLSLSEVETLYNDGVPLLSGTQPQASNLKAWWKLDESANWEADTVGAWQIPDAVSEFPQSFDFDGTDDQITLASSFVATGEFTLSIWINPTILNSNQNILGNGASSQNWINPSSATNIRVKPAGTLLNFSETGGNNLTVGSWNHILIYRNSSNDIGIFVNGATFGTTTNNSNTLTLATIGRGVNKWFSGDISNVAFWSSDQSSNYVNAYNNGSPQSTYTVTPTAWWKLDNTATFSTNWTVPDASGNGNTGTSTGMTEQSLVNNNVSTLNGESSGMTSGNLVLSDLTRNLPYENYSLQFDGGSDNLYIGTGLNLGTNSTVSFWIKRNNVGVAEVFLGENSYTFDYLIYVETTNKLYVRIGGVFKEFGSASVVNIMNDTTNWINIIFVRSGDSIELFLNGNSMGTNTGFGAVIDTKFDRIGAKFNLTAAFQGNISEVSAFNNALSGTEVQKLYANGMPQDLTTFTPQPVSWWTLGKESFWDGSDWVIRDMIGTNDGLSDNMGGSELKGEAPRSQANGVGTNIAVPTDLKGEAGWSDKNGYSINMSSTARTTDTP